MSGPFVSKKKLAPENCDCGRYLKKEIPLIEWALEGGKITQLPPKFSGDTGAVTRGELEFWRTGYQSECTGACKHREPNTARSSNVKRLVQHARNYRSNASPEGGRQNDLISTVFWGLVDQTVSANALLKFPLREEKWPADQLARLPGIRKRHRHSLKCWAARMRKCLRCAA
jgi:hypothetical protein